MNIYMPIMNIESTVEGLTVFTDGDGNYLVQNVDTKVITHTTDIHAILGHVETRLTDGTILPNRDEDTTQGEMAAAAAEIDENNPAVVTDCVVVDSSVIDSFAYFDTGTLEVVLHSGNVYHYKNVPLWVVNDFQNAKSAGQFYNRFIKNVYESTKIA